MTGTRTAISPLSTKGSLAASRNTSLELLLAWLDCRLTIGSAEVAALLPNFVRPTTHAARMLVRGGRRYDVYHWMLREEGAAGVWSELIINKERGV